MDPDFAGAPPDTAFHQIKEKRRHRNSYTVAACGPVVSRGKRAMDSEELAELARVDPKRVNRILGNRKSAAKSKKTRVIYEKELQVKVQQLAIQSANLDNSISFLQVDWDDKICCNQSKPKSSATDGEGDRAIAGGDGVGAGTRA
ncbi:hypothetical protein JHK87_056717 [Glycine soja]|nr:hypothetical protein JHK87_056717 [Glycine soja]